VNTAAPATRGKTDCAIKIAKLLLASGADPRIKNKMGRAPIDYAKSPELRTVLGEQSAT
jgi:hypothetical protein